ncbi:MAG: hypothetical protein ABJI00_15595, partial [Paracoccaceae bacterium]
DKVGFRRGCTKVRCAATRLAVTRATAYRYFVICSEDVGNITTDHAPTYFKPLRSLGRPP